LPQTHNTQLNSKTTILRADLANILSPNRSVVINQKSLKNTVPKPSGTLYSLNTLGSLKRISNFKFSLVNRFLKKSHTNSNIPTNTSNQKLLLKIKNKHHLNHFFNNNQNLTSCYYKYLNPKSLHVNTYDKLTPILSKFNIFQSSRKNMQPLYNQIIVNSRISKLFSNRRVLINTLYNPFLLNFFKTKTKINSKLLPYYGEASLVNICPQTQS
jgi:hypothetical protein